MSTLKGGSDKREAGIGITGLRCGRKLVPPAPLVARPASGNVAGGSGLRLYPGLIPNVGRTPCVAWVRSDSFGHAGPAFARSCGWRSDGALKLRTTSLHPSCRGSNPGRSCRGSGHSVDMIQDLVRTRTRWVDVDRVLPDVGQHGPAGHMLGARLTDVGPSSARCRMHAVFSAVGRRKIAVGR